MKKLFSFFLFFFFSLYAATNFTSDNAGTYSFSSATISSDGITSTIVVSGNQMCTNYEGQDYCVPLDGVLYELIINANGDVSIGNYDSTYVSQTDIESGNIYDDAYTSGFDFIFNDNSFTYCIDEGGDNSCITFIKVGSTEVSVIDTKEVESTQQEQVNYINSLSSYEYGSDEQKTQIAVIKRELEQNPNVEKVEVTDSGTALWVSYTAGFDGLIATTPEDSKGSSTNVSILNQLVEDKNSKSNGYYKFDTKQLIQKIKNQVNINKAPSRTLGFIGNKKVLAITAQYYIWGDNDDIPVISSMLDNQGYDVTYKKYTGLNSGDIEDFKNWDQYGIILLSSHGEASKTKVAIHINANIDISKYQDDLQAKRIVVWGNSYGVTQEFIDKYNGNFPNTLVYMSICKGAYNDSMADVLTSKGVASYIGYDNYVDVSFVKTYGVKLFEDLLNDGANLSTAYHSGIKEEDSDPAELKLYGTSNLSIQLPGIEVLNQETSIEDIVVNAVSGGAQTVNGHFIHYGPDSFDWIYVTSNAAGVYKLNGIKDDGETFDWSENLAPTFSSVVISADGKSVTFGTTTSNSEVAQLIKEQTIDINGHFIHYGPDSFDWIYITTTGKGVYKLNGIKDDGETFDWSSNIADKFSAVNIDDNSKSIAFIF